MLRPQRLAVALQHLAQQRLRLALQAALPADWQWVEENGWIGSVLQALALVRLSDATALRLMRRNDQGYRAMGNYQKGVVKWFNPDKGFGFITPDDGTNDIFVHFTNIQASADQNVAAGQKVSYVVVTSQKGPSAANVTLLP